MTKREHKLYLKRIRDNKMLEEGFMTLLVCFLPLALYIMMIYGVKW